MSIPQPFLSRQGWPPFSAGFLLLLVSFTTRYVDATHLTRYPHGP